MLKIVESYREVFIAPADDAPQHLWHARENSRAGTSSCQNYANSFSDFLFTSGSSNEIWNGIPFQQIETSETTHQRRSFPSGAPVLLSDYLLYVTQTTTTDAE